MDRRNSGLAARVGRGGLCRFCGRILDGLLAQLHQQAADDASTSIFSLSHCSRTAWTCSSHIRAPAFSAIARLRRSNSSPPLLGRYGRFLAFLCQFVPLGLYGRVQQGQFFSFAPRRCPAPAGIILQTALCFGQAPLGRFAAGRLGKLGPDLLDGHPHLERGPVRSSNSVRSPSSRSRRLSRRSLSAATAVSRRSSSASRSWRSSTQASRLQREFLFATGQVGFAPLLLIGLERMFPFQRLFTFFDQRPHVRSCSKRSRQAASRASRWVRSDWCCAPQLVLRRLDFLTGFLQMLLLEAETVLEQVALLLEAAQLLAVLLFELPLLFAQVLLAGVDALLQIVFDAGTHAIQFASGRLDLIPYGGPLAPRSPRAEFA